MKRNTLNRVTLTAAVGISLSAIILGGLAAMAQALPDRNHLWTQPKIETPTPFLVNVDDPRDKATVHHVGILTTNWIDVTRTRTLVPWDGKGQDPNFNIIRQGGTITSNTITEIRIQGLRTNRTVKSVRIGIIERTWTRKTIKDFSDGTIEVEDIE